MEITGGELWEFVRQETEEGRKVKIRVNSGSMRPFLRIGEEVLLERPTRPLRRGDVALARIAGGGTVLHAVTRISGDNITLRGSANYHARETCRPEDVAAVMVHPPRLLRYWPERAWLRIIATKLYFVNL